MSRVRNNLTKTVGSSNWIGFSIFSDGHIIPPSFLCSSIEVASYENKMDF